MSQPFSFPPPPPPPPRRETLVSNQPRGGFRGRGANRSNHTHGPSQATDRRGSYNRQENRGSRVNFGQQSPAPKRNYVAAFQNGSQNRPKAPPAVPSFEIDIKSLLPQKPAPIKPDAIKRKPNLLGLTPSGQDASDSSDDNDGDDEARLSAAITTEGMQFEHNGQKLSLETPAEIAAWIAERKKRFPTKVKAEAAKREADEKKKRWEEQKQARDEAFKLRREERDKDRNDRERKRLKDKLLSAQVAKAKSAVADSKENGALKAKEKAERLRKRAERAAKELKLAEEQLEQLKHQDNIKTGMANTEDSESAANTSPDSDLDDTSSSGSSSHGTESDIGPEETSSKFSMPERVPPPKDPPQRADSKNLTICKIMTKYGRCKFGRKCRFSHKTKREETSKGSVTDTKRKGLYQVLVEKEQEEELKRTLKAIIALGERGILDPPQEAIAPTASKEMAMS